MNMQSSNGNFEKYKSEMLRMYQQKNRPGNSVENNYVKNDKNNFYGNANSNDRLNDVNDETNYFSQQISDEIRLGDDFPPASYRQDISPHTIRGDSPIEYDNEGNRTSNLMFDNTQQNELSMNNNENQLIDQSAEGGFNNSRLSPNFDQLQDNNLNFGNMFQRNNENESIDNNLNVNTNDINTYENMQRQEDWMNFEARNTSNGFLKVQVYSAQGAFPLKDARVVISKEFDNQQKIFY